MSYNLAWKENVRFKENDLGERIYGKVIMCHAVARTYNIPIDFYSGYKDRELSPSFERASLKFLICDTKSQNNWFHKMSFYLSRFYVYLSHFCSRRVVFLK